MSEPRKLTKKCPSCGAGMIAEVRGDDDFALETAVRLFKLTECSPCGDIAVRQRRIDKVKNDALALMGRAQLSLKNAQRDFELGNKSAAPFIDAKRAEIEKIQAEISKIEWKEMRLCEETRRRKKAVEEGKA